MSWATWVRWLLVLGICLVVACGSPPAVTPVETPGRLDPDATEASGQDTAATPPQLEATARPRARDVHDAEGAGRWYPADALRLRGAVEGFVGDASQEPLPGPLRAVIVPHAGYLYSGAVAGHAYRALQDEGCSGKTVVVIGDSHTGHGSAEISVWAAGEFVTPLGALSVDQPVAEATVAANSRIEFDRRAFGAEHPVENQLPFIQVVCPGARIVPVVIRQASLESSEMLAGALVAALNGEPALIVASTDLSHYHPYDQARLMDEIALQSIVSLDPKAVADSPKRCEEAGLGDGDPQTMCSQGAVMTAIAAARLMGANRATVLAAANSGDVPVGERDQVVGYGAVGLWQDSAEPGPAGDESGAAAVLEQSRFPVQPDDALPIGPAAQAELLQLARKSAARFIETESFPGYRTSDPALLQPLGAYVTYELGGALRGCLGRLQSQLPLYLNVQYAAAAAALGDPRFPSVTSEELENLSIEITVLHPMREIGSVQHIKIGRDGILMQVGEQDRALFLPQVPVEQGWDLDETLVQLCRKAGLPDDAWQRPDTRFSVFSGQWFGEEE